MNKINYLTISGITMSLAGLFMLLAKNIGVSTTQFLVPLMFAIGGILIFLFSQANKDHKIESQFHFILGVSMFVFALLIWTIPTKLEEFLKFFVYFIGVFGFIEILFGFMVLNSAAKLNIKMLLFRFATGFLNLIGAILVLATSVTDKFDGLLIAGILSILSGIAFVIFSFRLRKIDFAV